ncbi:RagB/SusD family nutrient uptake outer membrane protein [Desertivirga brevis]|uniref:RagB/SusD family nutrient uptake outer membrane protein n=1 Tax=Desertivirga brevis TaxID=2810310 RepID=UPI001A966755|nr:RagB/SusD family nutrient uptake outer membrane protein [Pedobacter sp. SYSU D00873]
MKKYYIAILASLIIAGTSCKKFVEEELVNTLSYDYYKTDKGLEDLVRSAYAPVRWKFNGEQAYALHNFGDDEFILGDQFNFMHYNTYDPNLGANEPLLNGLWMNNYDGINRCNVGITLIPDFRDDLSRTLATDAQRNLRVAELRFLRAFYYFQLVQQFGGVPLVLDYSLTPRTEFPRASVAEVYNQIISDLQYAKNILPVTAAEQGRVTKGAAQHYLAKVYLTRGSAVTEARGQQTTDIDSAAFYADQVINSGTYALEEDYMSLFSGVYPDNYPNVRTPAIGQNGPAPAGDYSKIQQANRSREVIFAAQFTNNTVANGANGNRVHEYFIMQYDLSIPGLTRNADNFNGRPFRRLGPSDYTIDLFDRRNDSRFYKSFRTVYYSNTNADVPRFTATNAPNPSLVGRVKYGIGDTAALFIVNDRTNPILSTDISKFRYPVWPRYIKNATTGAITKGFSNSKYLTLVKHLDPVRITSNFNEENGVKNGILARLGETYLIAAEAYGRKADYSKALTYINKIRERAAYRSGEFRNPQTWMFDGGVKGDVSSTYPDLRATEALFETSVASELYPIGIATKRDRFIHFMLNERTRELCGELYRWEDLVRTENLYRRVSSDQGKYVDKSGAQVRYNPDATNIQMHHKLRPIPQQQIDLTTRDGKPMDTDMKKAYQNPGYN